MFLDGDAFPVRGLDAWMSELLRGHRLAAVRRDENAGDIQPHPCFCVTTVGFWNEIGGDWRHGLVDHGRRASTADGRRRATAVDLEERSIALAPDPALQRGGSPSGLLRVYEDHVYHHGAGFRPPISRADETNVPVAENEDYLLLAHRGARQVAPARCDRATHGMLARLARDSVLKARKLNAYIRREGRRSDEIYRDICVDPEFYRRFENTAQEQG